jgi:hypothetical protein
MSGMCSNESYRGEACGCAVHSSGLGWSHVAVCCEHAKGLSCGMLRDHLKRYVITLHYNGVTFVSQCLCSVRFSYAGSNGRVGLRPLAYGDSGFESHRGHGYFVCCVCCVLSGRGLCVELSTRPRGVLPTVARRYVWSRNLVVRGGHSPRRAAKPEKQQLGFPVFFYFCSTRCNWLIASGN